MSQRKTPRRINLAIFSVFLLILLIEIIILVSGFAWVAIDYGAFTFWIFILVTILSTTAGIVTTYSFIQYTQENQLRNFIFMFLGINVIILAFLFLLTHPVSTWSGFASRARNRTIVSSLGFLLTPAVLAGSLAGYEIVTTFQRRLTIMWGAIVHPSFSLWFFLSPTPVFTVTDPVGGLAGLTPIGWALTIVVGLTAFVSLIRYVIEWFQTHDRIVLASTFALIFWILSFFVYNFLENPLQIAELLWFGGVASGFILMAIAMILTSIIEPHRALEVVVEERTTQLEEAREESEFYLKLWTHKMGNLLQGMISYLELIAEGMSSDQDISSLQKAAVVVSREANLVNRQVAKLLQIKLRSEFITWPVKLEFVLKKSIVEAEEMLGSPTIPVKIQTIASDIQIQANDLVDIIFMNLFIRTTHHSQEDATIQIRAEVKSDTVSVIVEYTGRQLSQGLQQWLQTGGSLQQYPLDLDLFIVKLLMGKYGGKFEYQSLEDSLMNRFILTFRR